MSQVWAYLSVTALMVVGILLIFIILLQRGRGGGLAGAFGGAGGQSALGTKAGDVFTKITVGLAVFWVFLACLSIYATRASTSLSFDDQTGSSVTASEGEDAEQNSPAPEEEAKDSEPAGVNEPKNDDSKPE